MRFDFRLTLGCHADGARCGHTRRPEQASILGDAVAVPIATAPYRSQGVTMVVGMT